MKLRWPATWLAKRVMRRVLDGRPLDAERPELGRLDGAAVSSIYRRSIEESERIEIPSELDELGSRGNRLMVSLGVLTVALYRALRAGGLTHESAVSCTGDVGWRIYTMGVTPLRTVARLLTRDPQRQLELALRWLCRFPFAEDPRGYRRTVWAESGRFCTDWRQCAVNELIRSLRDPVALDLFRRTWCLYDFVLPKLFSREGWYERPHTLSHGDAVCDMRWYARPPARGEAGGLDR